VAENPEKYVRNWYLWESLYWIKYRVENAILEANMSDYGRLKKRLANKPYLVASALSGDVELVTEAEALRLMADSDPFPTDLIMNLAGALEGFARKVGKDDRQFALKHIAGFAGLKYIVAYDYVQRGIFNPSIRQFGGPGQGEVEARFSWADGFIAGLIGSLRRHRLPMSSFENVWTLFTENERAAQQLEPADRP
jgi:hypothetical protein